MLKKYADILIWDTVADKPENVRFEGVDYARIEMPVQAGFEIQMQDAGFYLADRTLKVSINLAKLPTGLEKFIRLPIEETNKYKKEIFELAVNSFLYDRRFHILPECSQEISAKVLKTWIDEQDNALVCLYKDKPIGFLELNYIRAHETDFAFGLEPEEFGRRIEREILGIDIQFARERDAARAGGPVLWVVGQFKIFDLVFGVIIDNHPDRVQHADAARRRLVELFAYAMLQQRAIDY